MELSSLRQGASGRGSHSHVVLATLASPLATLNGLHWELSLVRPELLLHSGATRCSRGAHQHMTEAQSWGPAFGSRSLGCGCSRVWRAPGGTHRAGNLVGRGQQTWIESQCQISAPQALAIRVRLSSGCTFIFQPWVPLI